jgi:aarF domain-containing kinase
VQVKFYRPTTRTLLKSAYDYLLHNLSSSSPSSSSPEAAEESDAVKHDRQAWLGTLEALYEKGYRPELVFIDAGLVTCLDETNRRNFLDLFVPLLPPLFCAQRFFLITLSVHVRFARG